MGGGGSSRNFPVQKSITFPRFREIVGPPAAHPPFMVTHGNSGTLPASAYTFKPRNNINSFQEKNIYQKFGGGHGPPGPPPGYATAKTGIGVLPPDVQGPVDWQLMTSVGVLPPDGQGPVD